LSKGSLSQPEKRGIRKEEGGERTLRLAALPDPKITSDELLLRTATALSRALGYVFAFFAAFKWIELPPLPAIITSCIAVVLSVSFFSAYWCIRRAANPIRYINPAAVLLLLLINAGSIVQMELMNDPTQAAGLGLTMLLAGVFYNSTPWLVSYLAIATVGGIVATSVTTASSKPELYVAMLFGAAVTALMIHGFRRQTVRGIIELRTKDAIVVRDLQSALIALRQEAEERERAEQSLRESEAKWRTLVENAPDIILVTDSDGVIQFINHLTEGFAAEHVVQRSLFEHLSPEQIEPAHRALQEVMTHGQPIDYEVEIQAPTGRPAVFLNRVGPIKRGEEVTGLIIISRDITDRIRGEEELRQLQINLAHVARLSTLGEMVAAIAHEINQPLYAISNFATACSNLLPLRQDADAEKIMRWTRQIAEQSTRVGEIIRRLRQFASHAPPELAPADLNGIVRESVELMSAECKRLRVEVRQELADPLPIVCCNRVLIQQVLVNLIRNAAEAMAAMTTEHRTVTLRTMNQSDDYLCVEVEDRGPGLPGDRNDFFEPFVSTKPEGMGIGLAICRTIVESHNGKIWAESNGNGAVFRFTVPVHLRLPPMKSTPAVGSLAPLGATAE
jgi:PAS domain S-box-containing protein